MPAGPSEGVGGRRLFPMAPAVLISRLLMPRLVRHIVTLELGIGKSCVKVLLAP